MVMASTRDIGIARRILHDWCRDNNVRIDPSTASDLVQKIAEAIAVTGGARPSRLTMLEMHDLEAVIGTRLVDGHCFYCREMTNHLSCDPGLRPLQFCQPDGTGITRFHHTKCVVDRLAAPVAGRAEPIAWRYRSKDEPSWEYSEKPLIPKDLFRKEAGFEEQPIHAALAQSARAPEGGK